MKGRYTSLSIVACHELVNNRTGYDRQNTRTEMLENLISTLTYDKRCSEWGIEGSAAQTACLPILIGTIFTVRILHGNTYRHKGYEKVQGEYKGL